MGEAFIPASYFPCKVRKFNLFAIHKSGPDRRYMALYPLKEGEIPKPDFHRLSAFQPTPFGEGVEINPNCGESGWEEEKVKNNASFTHYSMWLVTFLPFLLIELARSFGK